MTGFRFLPVVLITVLMCGGCSDSPAPSQSSPAAANDPGDHSASTTAEPAAQSDSVDTAESASSQEPATPATAPAAAAAGSSILAPGSPAPALALAAQLHGPEIPAFDGSRVTVVEFWATWCGPCLANMPHLSQLQQQYGPQVHIVGVSDEEEQIVAGFLKQETAEDTTRADSLQYSIAVDDQQTTYRNFMAAAERRTIPTAFIINRKGQIAWIGNPARMDEPLARIVAENWDLESARDEYLASVTPVRRRPPSRPVPDIDPLEPGMPAPPVEAYVLHGADFDGEFSSEKVYVVEFWATWCGPCLKNMPHLSELQRIYGDRVQLIGITSEDEDEVTEFLDGESTTGKKWRDVLTYSVATDDDGETNLRYMKAAGQTGIPCAFIVTRDQRIAWIGHPATMDATLKSVVEGTFDADQAAELFREENDIRQLLQEEHYDEALQRLAQLSSGQSQPRRFQIMRLDLLSQLQRYREYGQLADQVFQAYPEDYGLHNGLAWAIATGQTGEQRALDTALKIALHASAGTNDRDYSILDTVARVYYEQGNLQQAVTWQQKSVEAAPRVRELKETLSRYQDELVNQSAGADAGP